MNLKEIESQAKDPNEKFYTGNKELDFCLVDFWKWNQSDLIENRNRGILAEFIVKQALQIESETRLEWDSYDLITDNKIKIEIKSAAYIQAWEQKNLSVIRFDISPTKTLLKDNNYSEEKKRHADIYIFCLLHQKNQETINPLDLNQWTFYLVKTPVLDKQLQDQKTVGLSTLREIDHIKCNYNELRKKIKFLTSQ